MIRLKSLLNENTEATADSVYWAKKFKTDLNLTDEAAAAMAANIQHESGFIPDRIQGAGVKKGTLSDSGKLGYSWAQWTFGPRKQNFRNYVKKLFRVDIQKIPATAAHAYEFLKHEIKRYAGFDFDRFRQMRDVDAATEEFVAKYEQAGKPMLSTRQQIARDILNKIKQETPKKQQSKPNLIGKTVYPLKKNGFVNVRDEDYVNNGLINNIIKKINYPNPVGVVNYKKKGQDGKTWYYVKLVTGGFGWVRSDSVNMQQVKYHVVQPGDTLTKIASKYKTTTDTLKQKNQLRTDTIRIGQKLKI